MKTLVLRSLAALLLGAISLQCGNNNSTGPGSTLVGPPVGLKALSVNSTTVSLQWSTPATGTDSTLAAFVLQRGPAPNAVNDTVPAASLTFDETGFPVGTGATPFAVISLRRDGSMSEPASITWAPAARFDSAYTITESTTRNPTRLSGIDIGSETRNPSTMPKADVGSASLEDFYLDGGEGTGDLQLISASGVFPNQQTLFSTVTSSSGSLDYYLSSFPAQQTFSLPQVPVTDNTIYYVQVVGDNGVTSSRLFARIQVHVLPYGSPDRAVEVRISLQRVAGILYAANVPAASPRSTLAPLVTALNRACSVVPYTVRGMR